MSEGAQFKLAEKVRAALQIERVIHNPFDKKTKVLVKKQDFKKRYMIKASLEKRIEDIDPDDVRECGTPPEVAHIIQDDCSSASVSVTKPLCPLMSMKWKLQKIVMLPFMPFPTHLYMKYLCQWQAVKRMISTS
jgi:hypothetical protein